MPKKEEFLDRLQQRAAASANTRNGRHRAAFTAVREVVEAALGEGYAAKLVWQELSEEGRLAMSYATFLGHCRVHGLASRPAPRTGTTPAREAGPRGYVHSAVPRARDKLV